MKSLNELEPAVLTFVAEEMSEMEDSDKAREQLLPLLRHNSAIVREGAIYGVTNHINDEVRELLLEMAENDPSPGVRESAKEALDEE